MEKDKPEDEVEPVTEETSAAPEETSAAPETEVAASAEAESDPDDGKLYRVGAPWGGFTRYECLQENCLWDTLDRDSAIAHYATAHPYTGPIEKTLAVDSEGILNWKDN